MSVIPKQSVKYKKEYVLKTNNRLVTLLRPEKFEHFHEGHEPIFNWKWINLPIKSEGKTLNKLVIQNLTERYIRMNLLIRYSIGEDSEFPLVYYSPSREALITYDGRGYSLFGGVSNNKQLESLNYSTVNVELDQWKRGIPLHFQPLTKDSNGWGFEFEVQLNKNSSSFIYEWEFQSDKLTEIEDLHTQYQSLLGNQNLQ